MLSSLSRTGKGRERPEKALPMRRRAVAARSPEKGFKAVPREYCGNQDKR